MMACFCRRFPITMHCRSFGTIPSSTTTTIDGTRAFFEWLEKTYGARFGGKPLPMDGRGTNSSSGNSTNKTQTKNQMVVTKGSLELEDLERLFRHEIAVLKITNFYPRDASASLGRALAREGQHSNAAQNWKVSTSKGLESSDVVTVGRHSPYNIAVANQATDEYFREVRNELRDRRGLALHVSNGNGNGNTDAPQQTKEEGHRQPVLWPLDLLRLELDEVWPRGAGLARANTTAAATATGNAKNNNNNCMGGGLPRLMVGPTRWKKGLVHVDELAPLSDQHGCFSANIYLQLPYTYKEHSDSSSSVVDTTTTSSKINESFSTKEQPIMEVWPLGIRSKWDWYRNAPTLSHLASQDPEGQVILRKTLGDEHKQQISAAPGDLVLLCVQRPHCAIGFGHNHHNENFPSSPRPSVQTRVSLQCFLQYNGDQERLTIDS